MSLIECAGAPEPALSEVEGSRDVRDPVRKDPSLWESRQIQKLQCLYIP